MAVSPDVSIEVGFGDMTKGVDGDFTIKTH